MLEQLVENRTLTVIPRFGLQQGSVFVEPIYDSYSGLYRGIPHNWQKLRNEGVTCATPDDVFKFDFPSGKTHTFNLSNPAIAQMWAWIKERPEIAERKEDMLPGGSKPNALAYVEDLEGDLVKETSVKKRKFELEAWVRSLPSAVQVEKCKLLGQYTQSLSPLEVEDYLVEKARGVKYMDLEAVKIEKHDKTRLFLIELKERRIIAPYHKGYKFGDQIMGTDLESSLYWLNQPENRDVVMIWKRQINMGFEGENFSLENELSTKGKPGPKPKVDTTVTTEVSA